MPRASLGFRVRTGRATAVLLTGPIESPRVVVRREVELCDPAVPESRQPYHAQFQPFIEAAPADVRRASAVARRASLRVVRGLAAEARRAGLNLSAVGIVVSSTTDPSSIGNPHIRAHAAEGALFRQLLEEGAAACDIPSRVLLERELADTARSVLHRPAPALTRTLAAMGKPVGRPWRAAERAAALAAWVALARK